MIFGGSIEFSNTVKWEEGVPNHLLNWKGGSIEFSNSTIYNNTALYGGGEYSYLYNGGGIIDFSNCTLYNNSDQDCSLLFTICLKG